jgi:ribosomal protein L37AE/L43A
MNFTVRLDCLECDIKESVRILRIAPEIWVCESCNFWFERWELRPKSETRNCHSSFTFSMREMNKMG